jgi:hypothetical protein
VRARWSGTAALRSVRTTLSWPPRLAPERIFVTSARRDDEIRSIIQKPGAVIHEAAHSPRFQSTSVSLQPVSTFVPACSMREASPIPVAALALPLVNTQPVARMADASALREGPSMRRAVRQALPDVDVHGRLRPSRWAEAGPVARTRVDSTSVPFRQTSVLVQSATLVAPELAKQRPSPRSRAAEATPAVRQRATQPAIEQPLRTGRGVDLYSRLPIPAGLMRHGLEWLSTASRGVRLHTDTGADRIARRLNADAVAWGEHIFVRDGRFDPATPEGMALISHELVHVMQHRNAVGATTHAAPLIGNHHEHEALAVERTVLAVMRPQAGSHAVNVTGSPGRIATSSAPANAAVARAVAAMPFRAGEERAVEPAGAQGPATDPAELAKEVYKLFERRLRIERERVGVRRV